MADKVKELEAQLAAQKAEFEERLKEEQDKATAAEKALTSAAATGIVSPTVAGTFSVTGKDPESGEEVKKKFKFKNGRVRTPLRNGQQVPSAALIALANGKKHADIKGVETFPWFADVTQEEAQAELSRLVNINAATIEPA